MSVPKIHVVLVHNHGTEVKSFDYVADAERQCAVWLKEHESSDGRIVLAVEGTLLRADVMVTSTLFLTEVD